MTTLPDQAETALIILSSLPIESSGSTFSGKIGNQFVSSPPIQGSHIQSPPRERYFWKHLTVQRVLSVYQDWYYNLIDSYTRSEISLQHWEITSELDCMLLRRTRFLESEIGTVKRKAGPELWLLTPWARHLCSSKGAQPVTLFSQMYSPLSLTLQKWLSQPSWNISSRWNQRR